MNIFVYSFHSFHSRSFNTWYTEQKCAQLLKIYFEFCAHKKSRWEKTATDEWTGWREKKKKHCSTAWVDAIYTLNRMKYGPCACLCTSWRLYSRPAILSIFWWNEWQLCFRSSYRCQLDGTARSVKLKLARKTVCTVVVVLPLLPLTVTRQIRAQAHWQVINQWIWCSLSFTHTYLQQQHQQQ